MSFQLMLAPMEKTTDAKFRTLCYQNGADLTFTEIARVANLARGKKGELEAIALVDSTPTQIQLAGAKLADYEKFLSSFSPSHGFRGFNLNLGCSAPFFLQQGIGAAMVKRVTRTKEIVELIRRMGFECSVKMRLGENEYEKKRGAYLNIIQNVDASFFAVHARTAMQTLGDKADFSVYDKCVETGKKIVANGDIRSKEQIVLLKDAGLYGAMIGRAAKTNPKIFLELK
ncbi:tRNA-dihydrouridine synthase B [uncultured archaeon]|nr:tRNA-dihydrouridine synthase B [uncultured archaeon]